MLLTSPPGAADFVAGRGLRVAIVTNIPAPYRLPVYERLAATPGVDLCVFFFSGREPDREWDLGATRFKQVFLRERFVKFRSRFIHANPDVWSALREFRPDVVVTTGFNPTHLLAYAYARRHAARHVAMTDGTERSELTLSAVHRFVRQRVYAGTQAFVGASDGSFALYRTYGIDPARMFKSHLCANNTAFRDAGSVDKRFDFIFCGRFVATKNPLFAIELARQVARRLGRRVALLFVGSGKMEAEMRAAAAAAAAEVESVFAGFARQDELPPLYAAARILLFPTAWDPWGVVANEACAAGLPVLISPAAGAARELVRDGENGFVLPLDPAPWGAAAVRLLSDSALYAAMSARSRALVRDYSFDNAAAGLLDAVRMSAPVERPRRGQADAWRPKVVIIQRRLTHFRVPLFELMREQLAAAGIELTVVFGDATPGEQAKADAGSLSWGVHIRCHYWLNEQVCWQNAFPAIRGADLVVVAQENKLLFNYVFGMLRGGRAMAFWGHGRNFQARNPRSLNECLKRWLLTRADWWFAYTDASAKVVVDEARFAPERVTVLNNSIDVQALAGDLAGLTAFEVQQARTAFGIGPGTVGLVLASLHADKRLDFLIDAACRIQRQRPDFQLLIVGDGPQRAFVQRAVARAGGWMHWVGARRGRDKALCLRMSTVILNPGMVGLGVLDSFVAQVPMLTSACGIHSPEIAYLENGVNGLITADDVDAYAAAAVELIANETLYRTLQAGCERAAAALSVEKMAARFCAGIARCLERNGALPVMAAQT